MDGWTAPHLPRLLAAAAVIAAFWIGVHYSAFFPAGPDQSGYVSQAHGWATGTLRAPVPEWARAERWMNVLISSAPTGYAIDTTKTSLVPSYAPGLPLVMAGFERIGGRDAVFYVVPLFGSLAIWAAYVLGRQLAGPWAGVIAAVLLLCSPAFLWILIEPMSDVPAAACWGVALAFACRARSWKDALLSGIATAVGILIRPNVAPLALFPAALLFLSRDDRAKKAGLFAVATLPAVLLIAAINANWYGSPLQSGYGSLDALYAFDRVSLNAHRYLGWLVQTQTPMLLLWPIAAFAASAFDATHRVVLILLFPIAVLGLYLPYLSFDDWRYLRFLLPAYPVILAALAAMLVRIADIVRPRQLGIAAISVVCVGLGMHSWMFARTAGTFQSAAGEARFAHAVDLARTLPANAIFVSDAYSGVLHFYTGHDVLRWVLIPGNDLDLALGTLGREGHPLYFIGDPFEADRLKQEYANTEAAKRFDARRQVVYGEPFVVSDLTPP